MRDTGSTLTGRVLLTGGTGTLGRALLNARPWPHENMTIFSRDPMRQASVKRQIAPLASYVMGDVSDYDRLSLAMTGHDVVIHAAAMKHIPFGEENVLETNHTNVIGSINVGLAAVRAGVRQVVAISTDKVAYPVNVYGASKFLMERALLEVGEGWRQTGTVFNLCRYGNVIASTGSVLEVWQRQVEAGHPITVTDLGMTRFWMTPRQAVDLVEKALTMPPNTILIPKVAACTMEQLAFYAHPNHPIEVIGLRPGEKRHERLITAEETRFLETITDGDRQYYLLHPTPQRGHPGDGYTSDKAPELERDEFRAMLQEVRNG